MRRESEPLAAYVPGSCREKRCVCHMEHRYLEANGGTCSSCGCLYAMPDSPPQPAEPTAGSKCDHEQGKCLGAHGLLCNEPVFTFRGGFVEYDGERWYSGPTLESVEQRERQAYTEIDRLKQENEEMRRCLERGLSHVPCEFVNAHCSMIGRDKFCPPCEARALLGRIGGGE